MDSDGNVSEKYNVSAIPTSLFVDSNGVITRRVAGTQTYEQLLRSAQNAIKGYGN